MPARSVNKHSNKVRKNYSPESSKGIRVPSGLYYGIVVGNNDQRDMRRVRVNISKFYGMVKPDQTNVDSDNDNFLGAIWCRCMMPTGGITEPDDPVTGGQSTYGLIGHPPAKGTEVLVAVGVDNNSTGVIVGIMFDESRNFSFPGLAADDTDKGKGPAVERSKTQEETDKRPAHPQFDQIKKQGLLEDELRGLSSSGSRRESPSRVGGFTSPGGHSIVLDDGDESGDSNLIRIRTAAGAQFLLDDTTGICYFINKDGTYWQEVTPEGDCDQYAKGSFNVHCKEFNVHAVDNVNMQAGAGINMRATGNDGIKIDASAGDLDLHASMNFKLHADMNGNIRAGGGLKQTAGRIDLNGPAAAAAATPNENNLTENTNVTRSTASRVPEHEPWKGHKQK